MVYCGKPSRGCQMCRTRRIKCDETKPTCHQCQKSRRQCPGYKDDFDLVFRNETQATERRARRTLNKAQRVNTQVVPGTMHRSSSEGSSDDSIMMHTPISATSSSSTISLKGSISIPVEQQASAYFFSNFVLLPQHGATRGFLDYLVPMIKSDSPNSTLGTCLKAVTLASLGNRPHAKPLLMPAVEQYNRALQQVNLALRDPLSQKTDQTLASVLLLGLFETITSRRTALTAWGSHIEGAVMIVKMRGKKQLRTKVGQALFSAVRNQMMVNCMTSSKSPELGTDWWITDSDKDEVAQSVTILNLRTTELRATVNRCMTYMPRTPENISKVLGLMHQAQELELEFQNWIATVPEVWKFKTAAWVDSVSGTDLTTSDVYPGKVDTYSDFWIASVWNNARVARLFISGIIVRCAAWVCSPVDYRTTPEYAYAARLGVDMVNDMIASIPYFLGWRTKDEYEPKMAGISSFACGDDAAGACKGLGAYFCIWPLFTASCSDFTTDGQRTWIKGRMRFIEQTMGINQAGTLSYFQLRLPSMIVKRDALGLHAPNPAALPSPGGVSPSINPVHFKLPALPPGITNSAALAASYSKIMNQQNGTPSTAFYPMAALAGQYAVRDLELERAHLEWETRQKEEWIAQKTAWEKKRADLVEKAMGENAGYEFGSSLLEKYLGLEAAALF